MVSSHHRRPLSHLRLVGDVSSRSTTSHSDAKDILLSLLPGLDVDVPDTAHVTCPNDLCKWRSRCTLLKRGSDIRSGVDCSAIATCVLWNAIVLRAVLKINMLRFEPPSGTKHSLYFSPILYSRSAKVKSLADPTWKALIQYSDCKSTILVATGQGLVVTKAALDKI